MRVAVLTAPRRLELVDEPVPEPGPGQVLLRVVSCGVCASELHMWLGGAHIDYPRFPGHEVSGTIERAGPGVTAFAPGDPVAAWVTKREHQNDLVRWGREAVARIEGFYAENGYGGADDVKFTFMKDGARDEHRGPVVIGE